MLIGAPSPEERCGKAAREAPEDLLKPTSLIPVLLPIGFYLGPVITGRSWHRAIQFKVKWLYKALMGSVNDMRSFLEPLGLALLPPPSRAIVLGHNPTAS